VSAFGQTRKTALKCGQPGKGAGGAVGHDHEFVGPRQPNCRCQRVTEWERPARTRTPSGRR
jgi:hypothetical protein